MSNGLEDVPVNIASHSIEMSMTARVIMNAAGQPETIILSNPQGVEMKFPGNAYPFVKNGHMVLAIVSIVQVSKQEASLKPRLLIPGN